MNWIHELHWRPQIGDPTLMGWLTVLAYGLAAVIAWLAARRAARAPGLAGGSRGFWRLVAGLMIFLCLNKQLDLQSLVTDIGRVIAWKQGWYENRRAWQKWVILGLLGFSFLTTAFVAFRFRVFWRNHLLLGTGLAFLLTFIVIRAVSFHHVDALLKSDLAGIRLNWFLELTGIALVGIAAFLDWRNPARIAATPRK